MKIKNDTPMNDLQVGYRAITAASKYNLYLAENGYGADSMEMFTELAEEFAEIAVQFPDMDTAGLIEFYELHN